MHLEYKVSTAVIISEGKEHPSTFNLRLLELHFFTLSPNFIKKKSKNKERPKHLQTQNINSYSRTVWRVHACTTPQSVHQCLGPSHICHWTKQTTGIRLSVPDPQHRAVPHFVVHKPNSYVVLRTSLCQGV